MRGPSEHSRGAGQSISTVDALCATAAAGTARVASYLRRDVPEFEECDLRGEGLVDFAGGRVWIADETFLTTRQSKDMRARFGRLQGTAVPLIAAGAQRLVGGRHGVLYRGGAFWLAKGGGGWKAPIGDPSDPRPARNPLCLWEPLGRADRAVRFADGWTLVRGTPTQCYAVSLTEDAFAPDVWRSLAATGDRSGGEDEPIAALIHVDDALRIRRLAFEGSRNADDGSTLWCGTELWDFGLAVDGMPAIDD